MGRTQKVYVVTRGITRSIYSNLSKLSAKEKLDYWKMYRSLRKKGIYAEENVFIEKKPII